MKVLAPKAAVDKELFPKLFAGESARSSNGCDLGPIVGWSWRAG
jgi:hypothetical protein